MNKENLMDDHITKVGASETIYLPDGKVSKLISTKLPNNFNLLYDSGSYTYDQLLKEWKLPIFKVTNKIKPYFIHNQKRQRISGYDLWEIAPKSDPRGLRENYVKRRIFNIGDLVENLNTGLVGRIMRRGTNYLICVTEQDNMFKSWIHDVTEAVRPANKTGRYGVPSPQREVGTDAYREYAQSMVPGQEAIRNFINKYKAKK